MLVVRPEEDIFNLIYDCVVVVNDSLSNFAQELNIIKLSLLKFNDVIYYDIQF